MDGLHTPLSGWQVVAVFCSTLACSTLCILVPFILISKDRELMANFSHGSPIYLRAVTVILVVWTASALAVHGSLNQGASAIFGVIIGYVFGAVNARHPGA